MAAEDERLLQRALRAEESPEAERAAIIRVCDGLARRSFIVEQRAPRRRPLASTAVFAATAIVVAAVFAAACLPRRGALLSMPAGSSGGSAAVFSPAPVSAGDTYPATFVAVSSSGVSVVSSATGDTIRELSSGPPGVEASPSITANAATVYVTDSVGACGSSRWSEEILAVSTDGGPATAAVTAPPGSVDQLPTVSPDGKMLAWLRSPCAPTAQVIDVLDIATRTERVIQVPTGESVSALAWAPDDQSLLAVLSTPAAEADPIATVLSPATATSTADGRVLDIPLCASPYPRFLRDGTFVALVCPPSLLSTDLPQEIDFNATTGEEVRVLHAGAALPPVDAADRNSLLLSLAFSADGRSAIWTATGCISASVSSGGRVVSVGGPLDDSQVTW
ncbi:MAG: hypothetical protein WCB85_06355 [Candidatus Dormiibacterota bacterium]